MDGNSAPSNMVGGGAEGLLPMQQQLQASTRLAHLVSSAPHAPQALSSDDIPSELRAAVLGLRQRKPVDYKVCGT